MRLGLRRRLLALAAGFVLGGVLLGGVWLGSLLEQSLTESLRERLHTEARWLRRGAAALALTPDRLPHTTELSSWLAGLVESERTGFGLRLATGEVRLAGPVPWPEGPTLVQAGVTEPADVPLPGDEPWRAASVVVYTTEGAVECTVFRTTGRIEAAMRALHLLLGAIALLALASASAVATVGTRLVTRALDVLVEASRAVVAHRGGSRVPVVGDVRAFGDLAGSINALAESFETTVATLAAERDRFESVLEGLFDAVIAVDERQIITLFNRSAMQLFAIEGTAVGRPLLEVTRVPVVVELLERTPIEHRVKMEIDWPGRRRRRLLARATTLRGTAGGTVLVFQDLTALRRLETVRRDFVANVSHELRTPVGVILASAETLLDGALDDPSAARGFVEALHRNAERLARLVADLLDLSRIEAGQLDLKPKTFDLHGVVELTIDHLQSKAERRGTRLANEIPVGTFARADAKAVGQILVNLMDNALKYSPDGSVVRTHASIVDGRCRVCVEDNGPGIEPGHRERVFERFYRVDPGRSREMGGTGLGLSIVKHLAEHMGGEAGVESVQPHGSRFYFTLSLPSDAA